jgi:membrane-bound lytic murein transglycosylase D
MVAEGYDTLSVRSRLSFVDHYVTRGETLSEIARQYRVSVTTIQAANPSLRPRALRIGQRLIIPMSGRVVPRVAMRVSPASVTRRATTGGIAASHRVRSGETASQIARRYGVSLRALLDYNGLGMRSIIKVGQRIRIPPSFEGQQSSTE